MNGFRRLRDIAKRATLVATTTALVVGGMSTPAHAAPPHDISISDVSVTEGDAGSLNAAFTITYTGPQNASTVDWATAAQTATAGVDYTTSSGTASLPAAPCRCATVNVPVLGDTLDEADETFVVNLSNPSMGTIVDGQGVGTILDDDATPTISVSDASADEESGPLSFTITLSGGSGSTVTVDYATSDVSATAGSDYVAASGTATFAAGDTSEPVNVTLLGDVLNEGDEDLDLTLSNPANATIADGDAVGTIVDDDAPPALSVDDIALSEGDGGTTSGDFTISLSKPHVSDVTVDYATVDGTAVDGTDYNGASGTATFTAGDTEETVSVEAIGDLLAEDGETFDLVLSNETGGATMGDDTGTATINDDDPDPALSVADVAVAEGDGIATFSVTLDAAAGRDITVDYATTDNTAVDGDDYAGTSGTLTFVAGDTEETFDVSVLDDASYELAEDFGVSLSNASNASVADGDAVGGIGDDDAAPDFSVDDVTVDETAGIATFTVTKTGDTSVDASVDVASVDGTAVAGSDYDAVSSTLTFNPGVDTLTVDVTITDDAVFEGDEAFDLLLSNPVDAAVADDTGAGAITDDESAPLVSIDDAVAVAEGDAGDTAAAFTVTLVGGTTIDATVDYAVVDGSATAGDDVEAATGTVTIPVGETSAPLDILVHGDTVYEGDEGFTVELSNPTNATVDDGQGAGSITDDDPMPSIAIDDVSVNEGNTGTRTASFTVSRTGETAFPVTFDWATADGTAVAGTDYVTGGGSESLPAGSASMTVDVTVNGDTADEVDESFTVSLSNVANATVDDADGVGTITDDDLAASTLSVKAVKTASKVTAKGVLEPATSTSKVLVILQKRVGARWKAVAKKRVLVRQLGNRDADAYSDATYKARFQRPAPGRYRFVTKVAATPDATAASATKNVRL